MYVFRVTPTAQRMNALQACLNEAVANGHVGEAQQYLERMYALGADECEGKARCRCPYCTAEIAAVCEGHAWCECVYCLPEGEVVAP